MANRRDDKGVQSRLICVRHPHAAAAEGSASTGEDVEFLDAYVKDKGAGSRSAAVHEAVLLQRSAQLADA
jgi:hypothetical protein